MKSSQSRLVMRGAQMDPQLLDFVTWSIKSGIRLFRRVHVTPSGLVCHTRIPHFDFAVVVPVTTSLSLLNVADDPSFPLRVSPSNYGEVLPWWPQLTWGTFCFVGYLARMWMSGEPAGMQAYLNLLPIDANGFVGKAALESQKGKEYRDAVVPLVGNDGATFHEAFRQSYCLVKRHSIPVWSHLGYGHPFFAQTPFGKVNADAVALVPMIDMATHSAHPNAAVGHPDDEMRIWLAQERGIPADGKQYFVLQATRDIEAGEYITVDKNAAFRFDKATFEAWFGYPYDLR